MGTPQGGIISPLLSNLYLHILDRIWVRHGLSAKYHAQIIRYADDFVVLCKGDTEKPLELVRKVLDRLDLTLNTTKTHIVDTYKDNFVFLGFEFQMRKSFTSGKYYPHSQPAKKALTKIKSKVRKLTQGQQTAIPMENITAELNRSLRGWVEYFHYGNCTSSLSNLRYFVENRVASHLGSRHKIRYFQSCLKVFSRKIMYSEYGLYKIPLSSGWKKAHASK